MNNCKRQVLRVMAGMILLTAIVATSNPTYAQRTTTRVRIDTTKTYAIDEVVVVANTPRLMARSAMPSQILAGKSLENLGGLSVADALRYFSGIQLKDYGGVGGLKTVNVRSLGSAHTAVFYDGMSIGNAQNGQVDLGRFSLDNLEAIELYNGQKSSIFQPARGFFSSSTIFLRSKTPHFSGAKTFNLRAAFKTGSFGLVNPEILFQQKISPRLSLSASAGWVQAHGRYKYRYQKTGGYDTTAVRQNGDITALRSELTLHAKVFSAGRATLKAYLYDSERGLPGAIVANRYSHVQRQWDRNVFVHGSLQNSFFKNHDLMLNLKFSRDYTRYIDPDYKTESGALDNRYYQNEFYASMVNQYDLRKWWSMSLATDIAINTLDANLFRFPYPTRHSYLGALSSQMKWDRLDVQANLLAGYINEQVREYQQGDSRRVFCPVVSASVQPFDSPSFRLRAFYKESFRMPTFNELYYTFVGNSSLRPEYTTQYDMGATWTYSHPSSFLSLFTIQADVYYNRVKDKIVAMPSSNLFRWTMMNLDEVEIRGFETNSNLSIKLPAEMLLELGLTYAYQRAVDITSSGSTYGQQVPYIPKHSGTFHSGLNWRNLHLNYSFIYVGERYSQKANIPINYVQPWYTHDMAVVWGGIVMRHPTRIMLEVNNMLNQHYDVILNFPMPGRNFRLNFSINF